MSLSFPWEEITVPVEQPARVLVAGPAKAERAILLLHGYQQRASTVLKRLRPFLPASAQVISLDGPFVVPYEARDKSAWRLGHSWYFYDLKTQKYLIPM